MGGKLGKNKKDDAWRLFEAEGAYADSIFQQALGNLGASIAALELALEIKPDYAPAVLTMGSIEYQRGNPEEGARLFSELPTLPDLEGDLWEILDKAGDFLIEVKRYDEGLDLYQAAVERFPDRAVLYQGLGCCAGHQGLFDKAIEASQKAVQLEPERQTYTSDLGWTMFLAGRFEEAEEVLLKAVAMDSGDKLARENLRICQAERQKQQNPPAKAPKKRKGQK